MYQIIDQTVTIAFNPPSGPDPYEFIDLSFKFIESLVHKHLPFIDFAGVNRLLSAMQQFATYEGNVNIQVVVLELYHVIADHVASERVHTEDKLYEIWTGIFSRLKELGCDERAEMRTKVYGVVEAIINDSAESLFPKAWHYVFFDVLAQLMHFAELRLIACRTDGRVLGLALTTPTNIVTPKFSMGGIGSPNVRPRVMRFDEEALNQEKSEGTGNSKEKQWEETISSLLSALVRVFKRFHETAGTSKEKNDLRVKIWTLVLETFTRLMSHSTYAIINAVLKAMQQLAVPCKDLMHKRLEETWRIFEELMIWIGGAEHQIGPYNQRPIGSGLSPVVVGALRAVFCHEVMGEYKVSAVTSKMVQGICELSAKVMLLAIVVVKTHPL